MFAFPNTSVSVVNFAVICFCYDDNCIAIEFVQRYLSLFRLKENWRFILLLSGGQMPVQSEFNLFFN